jgi:uncharacterized membrane protein YhaH (DUF805 family)
VAGIMASARDGVPTPSIPEMGRFWAAMKSSLTNLTEGRQSPQQALDAAARRLRGACDMTRRLLPALFALALGSAALLMVMRVHAAGQTLLATTLMVITALALWTYTSARTQALRYLFPGIAAALVFVIFPMLYTIGIGFTNYSSRNLLEPERVRAYLLEERVPAAGTAHAFTLHATAGGVRLQLVAAGRRAAGFAALAHGGR